LFFFLLSLGACAPGLGTTVKVDAASAGPRNESVQFFSKPIRLNITSIADDRKEVFIGEINGRALLPDGNIPMQAEELIKKALAPRGVSFSPNATTQISGSIQAWLIQVVSGFPTSRADATATLVIEVSDATRGVQYRATYSGTAGMEHPFLGESNVEEVLGWALQSCIDSALEDGEFLAAIGVL
jgi:uncharacterized lipoprotein YajG